jgi:FkbM family methyltransferase
VLVHDRVVLDLGANVGGFSHMAIRGGAKEVYSFEPEPHTYALLVKNIGNSNVVNVYNRVISNRSDEFVNFYVGHGMGSPSLASAEKVRGRRATIAKNQNFKTFVDIVQPHTIKIDIEGGEYGIVDDIPDSCDEITLEWHGLTQKQVRLFKQVYPMFMSHKWTIVTEKKREFYKKHSSTHNREPKWVIDAHYRR